MDIECITKVVILKQGLGRNRESIKSHEMQKILIINALLRWGKLPEQCCSKKNSYTPEGRRCRKIKHTMRKLDHKYKRSLVYLLANLGNGGLYYLNGYHALENGELSYGTVIAFSRR